MLQMPWSDPIKRVVMPYHNLVLCALLLIFFVTGYVIIKGNNSSRVGWLVDLMTP